MKSSPFVFTNEIKYFTTYYSFNHLHYLVVIPFIYLNHDELQLPESQNFLELGLEKP